MHRQGVGLSKAQLKRGLGDFQKHNSKIVKSIVDIDFLSSFVT